MAQNTQKWFSWGKLFLWTLFFNFFGAWYYLIKEGNKK